MNSLRDALRRWRRARGPFVVRVRIKPSWSAKVYGTYYLYGRHFALAALFGVTTLALLGRLVCLNLAEPGPGLERQAIVRSSAHIASANEIRQPARIGELERLNLELGSRAHQLAILLGLRGDGTSFGLGGMDTEVAPRFQHAETASARLGMLDQDVVGLEQRFGALRTQLSARESDLRFTPSIVPILKAEFVATSPFGTRVSPFTSLPEQHRGQDLAADLYTKIVATADGTVVHVERDARRSGMGRFLVVDHAGRFQTYFGHCERIFVEVGETVVRHQVIAEVGSTGRSTGPHVHYEVRTAGEPRDPRHFMVFDPRFASEEQLRFD